MRFCLTAAEGDFKVEENSVLDENSVELFTKNILRDVHVWSFSDGENDPLDDENVFDLGVILSIVKKNRKAEVWIYTDRKFTECLSDVMNYNRSDRDVDRWVVLNMCDYLFENKMRRVLDIQKTLKKGEVVIRED